MRKELCEFNPMSTNETSAAITTRHLTIFVEYNLQYHCLGETLDTFDADSTKTFASCVPFLAKMFGSHHHSVQLM